eukprot:g11139.t1 g11139   contig5:189929-191815(+)
MSKRYIKDSPDPKPPAKRKNGDSTSTSSSVIDLLCDNTMMRVMSFADIPSLFHFTRGTSKALRARFDPQEIADSNHDINICSRLWRDVYDELNMSPRLVSDETGGVYSSIVDEIRRRLSLFSKLTAESNKFPLRYSYFRPLEYEWKLELNESDDEEEVGITIVDVPFAFTTQTGGEHVIISPVDETIELHRDILKNVECRDKSVQKRIMSSGRDLYFSCELIMGLSNVESYFGPDTPFATIGDAKWRSDNDVDSLHIEIVSVHSKPQLVEKDKSLAKKTCVVTRLLSVEADETGDDVLFCTEAVVWRESNGRHDTYYSQYVCRIAMECSDCLVCVNTKKVYVAVEPSEDDGVGTISRFALIEVVARDTAASYFPAPETQISINSRVSALDLDMTGSLLYVGTAKGMIEVWNTGLGIGIDTSDEPRLIQQLDTRDTFGQGEFVIRGLRSSLSPLRSFVTEHFSDDLGFGLLLWQTTSLNHCGDTDTNEEQFQLVARIGFKCYPGVFFDGRRLFVLTYDKFGSTYLNLYHVFGSRFEKHNFGMTETEESNRKLHDGKVTNLHPDDECRIRFLRRVTLRNRTDIDHTSATTVCSSSRQLVLANERFVVVSAHGGMIKSNWVCESGPGFDCC